MKLHQLKELQQGLLDFLENITKITIITYPTTTCLESFVCNMKHPRYSPLNLQMDFFFSTLNILNEKDLFLLLDIQHFQQKQDLN